MTQFILSVGQRLDNMQDCGPVYEDVVGRGANVTIECDLVGRYVTIRRVGGNEIHLFTICELQMYGYLSTGKFIVNNIYDLFNYHRTKCLVILWF